MIQLTVGSADHVRATIVDLHAQYGIAGGYIVLHNFIVRFGYIFLVKGKFIDF
jgi:hypothetical protein